MQRRNVGDPIKRFLDYQKQLKRSDKNARVIAFLGYFTKNTVEETKIGRLVRDPQTGGLIAAPEEKESMDLHPMIGLQTSVNDILAGKDIEIVNGCKIGQIGKEWLKLLGVRWWATENPDHKEYYIVPSKVQSKEVESALEVLKMGKVNQDDFKGEVGKIFDANRILDEVEASKKQEGLEEGRAKGEMIGILKGLIRSFVKGREIEDDEIEEIVKNSLDEDFVREIWNTLSNIPDSKNAEDFIQILRNKGLLNDGS